MMMRVEVRVVVVTEGRYEARHLISRGKSAAVYNGGGDPGMIRTVKDALAEMVEFRSEGEMVDVHLESIDAKVL
jgi:hypothetical protein